MSARFAEREHRRATSTPPVESVDEQLAMLDARIADAMALTRRLGRELKSMRVAAGEIRRDVAGQGKKGK